MERTAIRHVSQSRPAALVLLALGFSVGLSAVFVAGAAIVQRPVSYFLAVFELVVAFGAIFSVLVGRGRFVEGRAITLLCIAGVIGVASLLGYLGCNGQLHGYSLRPLLGVRAGLAALLTAFAAADVLWRRPERSLPMMAKGLLACMPLLLVGVLAKTGIGASQWSALPGLAQVLLAMLGFCVLTAMLCASVHFVVGAFAVGVKAAEEA